MINLSTLAHILNGTLLGENAFVTITQCSTDTRTVTKNGLFFCIKGTTYDGHSFLNEVAQKGVAVAIGEQLVENPPLPYIQVENTIVALGTLAHYKRRKYPGLVIGITGSAGKTTFKECLYHILSCTGTVSKNQANFNNQLGLALSILAADDSADAWILELGISQPHDMFELGAIAEPNIVCITNTTHAHTEGLGDKGVPYYKSSISHFIPATPTEYKKHCVQPTIFTPSTETEVLELLQKNAFPPVCAYNKEQYSIHFEGIDASISHCGNYSLCYDTTQKTFSLPFIGAYFADVLAGLSSIAHHLHITEEQFYAALTTLPATEGRASIRCVHNNYIIDDTYNANPLSMKAMLQATFALPTHSVILLLGTMGELGGYSQQAHYDLGKYIASLSQKPILCYWQGDCFTTFEQGLRDANFTGTLLQVTKDSPSQKDLEPFLQQSFAFLAKASRSVHLEHLLPKFYSIFGV